MRHIANDNCIGTTREPGNGYPPPTTPEPCPATLKPCPTTEPPVTCPLSFPSIFAFEAMHNRVYNKR